MSKSLLRPTEAFAARPAEKELDEGPHGGGQEGRREFLRRATVLTLTAPGLGAVLVGSGASPTASARQRVGRDTDRREPGAVATTARFERFDPRLPPLSAQRTLRLHFHAREAAIRIADDEVVAGWTFGGNIPAPIVHCRVGDTVDIMLTNDVLMPHSVDCHAAQVDPKVALRSVLQGQSGTYRFSPKYAGIFLYHCGTAPVLMHMGAGMYGAIVVSPREPLPRAKEFVLLQSEFYLGTATNGVRAFDYQKMLSTLPDYVAFNGRPNQYVREPIQVSAGDRVRFWIVNAGPTHPCAFHIVGEQFETVYLGAPPLNAIHGVQTFSVPPGGGMCFELVTDVPGEFPFVNHAFGHGQKGSIGRLVVER
jgi:nitrite reductase (NO-forming)